MKKNYRPVCTLIGSYLHRQRLQVNVITKGLPAHFITRAVSTWTVGNGGTHPRAAFIPKSAMTRSVQGTIQRIVAVVVPIVGGKL